MRNSKRAISPVITIILLIAVGIAAAGTVTYMINNSNKDSSSVDTNNIAFGSTPISSQSLEVKVLGISGDISLILQNISDYSQVVFQITYTGPASTIYIVDIDIVVNGVKLDDYSPWTITDAIDATYTSYEGRYAGYLQDSTSTAIYTVEVEDINDSRALIPKDNSFTYQIKYGEEIGQITSIMSVEKQAKIVFEPIFFNVSIFNYGSTWSSESAAYQLEQTLKLVNGSNNLYFRYNRVNDTYDISDMAIVNAMNTTWMNEYYQVIMIDRWLVPLGIGTQLTDLHNNGTSLMFYGGLIEFDPVNEDWRNIVNKIDYAATENITGLIPNIYSGSTPRGSINGYSFYDSFDGVLSGLAGETFLEIWDDFDRADGDKRGFDAALITTDPTKFDILGNATYNFYDRNRLDLINRGLEPIWNNSGPVLIRKNPIVNVSGEVYSYVWKTNENFKETKAIKTNLVHLSKIRKNMLLAMIGQLARQAFNYAELTIDSVNLNIRDNQNKRFDIEITATISNADIKRGSLVIILDMPDGFDWRTINYDYYAYLDGNRIVNEMPISINTTDYTLTFNIGKDYDAGIPQGSNLFIVVNEKAGDSKWMEFNSPNTNYYNWTVDASFESGLFALPGRAETYQIYTAVDIAVWP